MFHTFSIESFFLNRIFNDLIINLFFCYYFFCFQNTNTVPKKVSSSFMCHFDYLEFALSYRILDLSNGFWLSYSFIFDITELTNTIQINFTSLISFYFFEIFYCLLNFIIFIS